MMKTNNNDNELLHIVSARLAELGHPIRLNVFKLNSKGESEHLAELREGSFVGEHALLKNARRSATVRAKTYVTLLRLTADEVIKLSKILPELQLRLAAAELSKER